MLIFNILDLFHNFMIQTYNNAPTYASRGSPIYKFKVL